MGLRHNRRTSRAVLIFTFVSLACKFLIPVGFMPAAISEGWPVRMCHTGLPEGLFSHDGHRHEHNSNDDLRLENCTLGASISAAAITIEHARQVPQFHEAPTTVDTARLSIDTIVLVFRSRAPPT